MCLVRAGISGWELHPKTIRGRPDFYFPQEHLAVFVDGCFWHGCAKCGHTPLTRSEFWAAKFERNRRRDKSTSRLLRKQGVRVLRIWEHRLKDTGSLTVVVQQLSALLEREKAA